MKLKCLIVDDEPLAQKGISDHIKETGFLELSSIAEDPAEALEFLATNQTDIIFLDIQMPKMTGISFLEKLKTPPIVIICSAYSEYALQGFELDVLDYLLKPVTYERFFKAAIKAKEFHQLKRKGKSDLYLDNDYFFVKSNNLIQKISLADIKYIEATGNYVTIHTKKKKLLAYITLKGLEESLPGQRFVKVHKSYLVPLSKIDSINEDELKIDDTAIPISRIYREKLMQLVNNRFIRR